MSERDKKLIRFTSIGLGIYLVIFFGFELLAKAEEARRSYKALVSEARNFNDMLKPYETRILLLEKLRKDLNVEPGGLDSETLVADVSAAIQEAAGQCGLGLGPLQESPSRATGATLTTMRLSGEGQIESIIKFVHAAPRLGFPILIETLNVSGDESSGAQRRFDMELRVLDYKNWKPQKGGSNG